MTQPSEPTQPSRPIQSSGPIEWGSQVGERTRADRLELAALANRYLDSLDDGDVEAFVDVFADDGALHLVQGVEHEVFRGHVGVRGFVEQHGGTAFHTTSDPWLVVSGDVAVGRWRWTAYSSVLQPDGTPRVQWVGRYLDELVRTPAGWRIASRQIVVFTGH